MTPQAPQISIILPVRNGERFLSQAVESCLEQTLKDFELIIVDDGSTDNTPRLIETFTDPRIRVVRHPSSKGMAAALNSGFRASRGEFLTWVSDDDFFEAEALATLKSYLDRHGNADFVYSHYDLVDENGCYIRAGKTDVPSALDEDNCVGHCFLYRRCVYEALGDYHSDAFLVEDYEYWLRVRKQFRMVLIDPFLFFHRLHPASLTMVHSPSEVMDQVHAVRKPYIAGYKNRYFEASRAVARGDQGAAQTHLLMSVLLNPFFAPAWKKLFNLITHRT